METRFCIEYVNPRHPLRDNGGINVRYDRVLTLEQAEHNLTLILSFGAKILNLYMGNAADGKTGEWSPIPMIVDDDDWFTTDWLKSLESKWKPSDEQMVSLVTKNGVEYVRTDAFIEKACVKLKRLMYDNLMFQGRLHRKEIIENFVGEFKKYMKGE